MKNGLTGYLHRRTGIFPGWVVVAAAFGVMFIAFGNAYTFATFLGSLQEEFAATRGEVSTIFSAAGFLYFTLGAVSGPLADRLAPRWVVLFGMLVLGGGMLLAAGATSLWHIYLAHGLGIGIGVGFAYVPAVGAVQRWFVVRRGFASGLAVAGIGAGTLVMPLVAAACLDRLGWRGTYVTLGILAVLAGGALALLLEQSPARHGLHPDGAAGDAATTTPPGGLGLRGTLAAPPFWLLYGSGVLSSVGVFLPFVHLIPYAEDRGIPTGQAVALLGLIGIGSTAGRFLLGGIADRIGRRVALAAMYFGMALMLGWWVIATSLWQLAAFALLFGIFYGGFVALLPAFAADCFGHRSLSSIIGALYTSVAFGTLVGPAAAGFAFDLQGSYVLPILAGAGTGILAAAGVMLIPEPGRR